MAPVQNSHAPWTPSATSLPAHWKMHVVDVAKPARHHQKAPTTAWRWLCDLSKWKENLALFWSLYSLFSAKISKGWTPVESGTLVSNSKDPNEACAINWRVLDPMLSSQSCQMTWTDKVNMTSLMLTSQVNVKISISSSALEKCLSRFNLTYLGAAIYQSLCEVVCQSLYKEHSGIPSKKPTSCSPWEVPRLDFQAWYRLEQGAQCFQLGALSFHTSIDWTRNSAGKVNKSNKGRQKSMQKYWRFELINNVTPPGYSPGVKALQKVGTSQLRLADRNKTGGSSCTRNWSLWQIVASSQASQPAAFCAATSWRLHRTLPNHQTESNVFQFSKPPFSFQEQFISSTCRGPTSFRTTMQKPQLQQLGNDTEVPKSSIEVKRSNHVKPTCSLTIRDNFILTSETQTFKVFDPKESLRLRGLGTMKSVRRITTLLNY